MPTDPFDDDDDVADGDDSGFGAPLPPDDRIWRHPSEVGGIVQAARRRREITNGKLIGFALTASLLGSVITVGALAAGGAFDRTVVERSEVRTVASTAPPSALLAEGAKWPQVVQALAPSVARIEGHGDATSTSGTAIAFRDGVDGTYFVTSLDLVEDMQRVTLVLAGERSKKATVVGTDAYTNLAVVLVEAEHLATPLINTTDAQPGAEGVVLGAPSSGPPSPTVAKALVGSIGNRQTHPRTGVTVENLLRTDANVTGDAKGGALIGADGAVIGIVVLMQADETGVERFGYALPGRVVASTAESLIRTGFPTQAWLGIFGKDLAPEVAQTVGVTGGAVLTNVAVNGPAAECGLVAGDVVTKINTDVIESMSRLVMALRERRPGDTVAIEYLRAGALQTCLVALSKPPEALPADGSEPLITSTTVAPAAGAVVPAVVPAVDPSAAGTPEGSAVVPAIVSETAAPSEGGAGG
ncbi:MAG: serine protease [Acidimicrobiales bacterium]|nr:serine protease [Acidimicrobiales bacterium]